MPYKIEKIVNEPVIVFTLWGAFDILDAQERISQEVMELVKDVEGPYYVIDDYSGLVNINFGDMVMVMAEQTKRNLPGSLMDPRANHVLVGSNEMIEFAAKSFDQSQYGEFKLPIFTSFDDAMAYIHSQA